MSLLQEWREYAYSFAENQRDGRRFWEDYFEVETGIYEEILSNPDTVYSGTVEELADKFDVSLAYMVGFLDGINDSLVTPNPIEDMDKDTQVSLEYDKEKLYYNMVANKAEWLYELPQWDDLLSVERREELYKECKLANTVIKGKKIGRNEPCPCGSGKKYKHCCGK
ncbi:MAG: SEC-C domain-containing protein [Clostridiales bacterium]|nr:SEC-C domain-containing protein [Clostridiales bacterium]